MFGLGFFEVLTLSLLGFLVFGPKKFAEIARNFLKVLNELKQVWGELQARLYEAKNQAEMEMEKLGSETNLKDLGKNLQKLAKKPIKESSPQTTNSSPPFSNNSSSAEPAKKSSKQDESS